MYHSIYAGFDAAQLCDDKASSVCFQDNDLSTDAILRSFDLRGDTLVAEITHEIATNRRVSIIKAGGLTGPVFTRPARLSRRSTVR